MATSTIMRAATSGGALERLILVRVDRAIGIGEGELRYQLEHKHDHPIARAAELLDVLAELEACGLLVSELCFRLTAAGRVRLAELNDRAAAAGRAG